MHVLLIKLNLLIPNAHSLKDKRRQIKSLKDRLANRFNMSIAEVEHLDSWQQSLLALCLVSNDKAYLDKQFSLIETLVLSCSELALLSADREWL